MISLKKGLVGNYNHVTSSYRWNSGNGSSGTYGGSAGTLGEGNKVIKSHLQCEHCGCKGR